MNYNEVESKLQELDKVIIAFKEAIRLTNMHIHHQEYMNIPIEILNREMEDLKSKIVHLKENAIVTYDGDIIYIDKLLNPVKVNVESEA